MPIQRRTFLAASAAALAWPMAARAEKPAEKTLVLLGGTMSHGPGDHEFNAGVRLLAKCLANVDGLAVEVITNGYPKDDAVLDKADGLLCFADGGGGHPLIREKRLERIGKLMDKGVGLMCAHYGVEVPKDLGAPQFKDWIGGYYESGYSCNPMWTPEFKEFPKHAITSGVKPFAVRDEWYMHMRFRDKMEGVTPLLSADPGQKVRNGPYVSPRGPYKHIQEATGPEHMMWATERKDGGRGVGFTGGHFHKNWGDENFRKIVLNALVWLVKLDVPKDGIASELSTEALQANLDPKKKK